jgi:hypothetical protein
MLLWRCMPSAVWRPALTAALDVVLGWVPRTVSYRYAGTEPLIFR